MKRAMAQSMLTFASVLMIVALAGCGGGARPVAGLPDDNTLQPGAIPAGESRTVRGPDGVVRVVTCPADGEACSVTPGEDDTGEPTDDAPVVVTRPNEMIRMANNGPENGPGETSDGAHARAIDWMLRSDAPYDSDVFREAVTRVGAIVQSTESPHALVTATASWETGTAPTLGLTVGGETGFSNFYDDRSFSVDGDSSIPNLGEGWNGVALIDTTDSDLSHLGWEESESTGRAIVYSNIERSVGGTPDEDYLIFGVWLYVSHLPDSGTRDYGLGVFADGHAATELTRANILALTGTATYEGPATGLYTKATYSAPYTPPAFPATLGDRPTDAQVGSFTATARITADFGTGGSAVTGMSGNVANFMENGEPLGDWTVNLNSTDQVRSTRPELLELFYGSTGGQADGQSLSGQWGVQFYRNSASGFPDSAVGVFTASGFPASIPDGDINSLSIVGAYGAERQ